MQRTFIRQLLVGTAFVLVTAVTATSAFAASSNRRHFAGRAGIGMGGPGFGMMGGPGFGMRGRFGGPGGPMGEMGFGGDGPRGGPGGILGADVLTPAAGFLGVL